jgi:uncharacterized protein YndB with AHSA1/START domain
MSHPTPDPEILITRTFDAPRELVFKAWSETEFLQNWFAPNGCTLVIKSLDFRPGGSLHCCIQNPAVRDCWTKVTYTEIVPPELIAFTMGLADENGNSKSATAVGLPPEWPDVTNVTLRFTEEFGRTTMTLHQTVSEALARQTGAYPSWLQMLDRLEETLAKVPA